MDNAEPSLWDLPSYESTENVVASASVTTPSLCTVFEKFRAMQAEVSAARERFSAVEQEIIGETVRSNQTLCIEEYAEAAVKAVFSLARKQYGTNGVELNIDETTEMKSLGLVYWRSQYRDDCRRLQREDKEKPATGMAPVDLQRIADHLAQKFGGAAGERIAHQQQAKIISDFFRLQDMELKESSFGIVISRAYYVSKDKWDKTTRYEIHYQDKDKWRSSLRQAFVAFARHTDLPIFESEIGLLAEEVSRSGKLSMPSTWSYSQVRLKIFTGKMELTLHRSVAAKLQLYLGEFFIPNEH